MKKITKIVTFYDDGTFTESVPSPTIPYTPSPYMPTPVYPYTPLNPSPWPTWQPPYTIYCSSTSGKKNV